MLKGKSHLYHMILQLRGFIFIEPMLRMLLKIVYMYLPEFYIIIT